MDGPRPRLILAPRHLAALRAAARGAYPEECCALLIGRDVAGDACVVTRLVAAANVHPTPRRAFEFDPAVLIATLRRLREAKAGGAGDGERLLGHAHSHPDAPARPSETDRAMAFEPGHVWLIIPVERGVPGAPMAWRATASRGEADERGRAGFQPVALETADGDGFAAETA